ncbi:sensor histidine kinase [Glutamicibacter sp. 287]|uniref:sensor histidine kinase n=1 Tax=unclassified Glutamicibacter TaxID=2627139 RepID=UPI0040346EA8
MTTRRSWSIRARVLTGMLLVVGLALLVAGAASYAVQRHELNERLDDSLSRTVQEFGVLAETGVDPRTLQHFEKAEDLLYTAMQRTLPSRHQGMLGLAGGEVQWTAPDVVQLRLEDDPEFLAWAEQSKTDSHIHLGTVKTEMTTYRAAIVPVQLPEDPSFSAFVLAYDYLGEARADDRNFAIFSAVGVLVMALAAGASWLVVNRTLEPIRRLQTTAHQISESDLSRRIEVTGNDEFAELTVTINEMLDRLESALKSQRQLLDDVGHELRTPVTIVSGHLELMDTRDPEDVQQSKEIALDEMGRMSLLINDLVMLAKSNRADFIQPQPTEVGTLLDDILDKARGLGDRHWRVDYRSESTVNLDQTRITQAMLQLCANAVKFSPEGTRIGLGNEVLRDGHGDTLLRWWVSDTGVGIQPDDIDRIFERFGRGKNSVRADGSGLGLNIVSAIATAHGGRVWVDSEPNKGSTFYIDIPLTTRGTEA